MQLQLPVARRMGPVIFQVILLLHPGVFHIPCHGIGVSAAPYPPQPGSRIEGVYSKDLDISRSWVTHVLGWQVKQPRVCSQGTSAKSSHKTVYFLAFSCVSLGEIHISLVVFDRFRCGVIKLRPKTTFCLDIWLNASFVKLGLLQYCAIWVQADRKRSATFV